MKNQINNPEGQTSPKAQARIAKAKRLASCALLFSLGYVGYQHFVYENFASAQHLETVSLSSIERAQVAAVTPTSHDPITNLSSLVGTYKLVQTGNRICGSLGEPEMEVKFFGSGKDLVFSLSGTDIRFMKLDSGWDIDPIYPEDKTACAGERLVETKAGQLSAHEITKCKGKEIAEGFSEVSIVNSRLVYRFHQTSTSPEMLNIPQFTCEWVKF